MQAAQVNYMFCNDFRIRYMLDKLLKKFLKITAGKLSNRMELKLKS